MGFVNNTTSSTPYQCLRCYCVVLRHFSRTRAWRRRQGRVNLEAVRSMQISLGLPDPSDQSSMPMLKRMQAGIKRVRAVSGAPSRNRLSITATVLEQIGAHLAATSHPHKELLWAISCTAFFGFFRLGELNQSGTGHSGDQIG